MKFLRFLAGIVVAVHVLTGAPVAQAQPNELRVYIGTYTDKKSKGIYMSQLDLATGRPGLAQLAAETVNPSFLAIHPNGRVLYAVNEVGEFGGKKSGAVSAFAIDRATGLLTLLNQQPSGGGGPCHLVVDRTGRHVLVANYGGGSVGSLPIQADGKLGQMASFHQHKGSSVNPQRQKEPHAHSVNLDRNNRFAYVADLGLDKILIYRFDDVSGVLAPNDPPWVSVTPGAGPRHFTFHPNGSRAYVINEMACTVTAFLHDAKLGVLKETQTISTLPPGQSVAKGQSTAEVVVHPSGRFVYGSNRGHDTIVILAMDATGKLSHVENVPTQGKTPRNFAIDPTGSYLLAENQGSDGIVVFRIDPQTGRLTPTGQTLAVPSPVCVKFLMAPAPAPVAPPAEGQPKNRRRQLL
ncbi:MAG: lactonase family protein [Verrucomicrobiota bacterium]